jgi:hypothetical protein
MMSKEDYSLAQLVQRAKVAAGKEIPEEVRTRLESLSKQLEEMETKLTRKDEAYAKLKAERAVKRIERETQLETRRQKRAATKADLDAEFALLSKQFGQKVGSQLNANPLDTELISLIGKMAKNRVQAGVTSVEGLVDEIHAKLKDHVDDKRDIRDAISGYGQTSQMSKDEASVRLRELKRRMRLVSSIEDAESGQRPARTGLQREPDSAQAKQLRRELAEVIKREGLNVEHPPVQGPKLSEGTGRKEGPRIAEAPFVGPQTGDARKLPAEGPKLTDAPLQGPKDWLPDAKKRIEGQIANLESQIRSGQFTNKEPRTPLVYDAEGEALKQRRDRLKAQADTEIKRLERANRSKPEKLADFIVGFSRAVKLSSVYTLGKLSAAASLRTISTPVEEAIGGLYSKLPVLNRVAERAPREGGFSLNAEGAALKNQFSKETLKDAAQMVRTGRSRLDAYGGKPEHDTDMLNLFGQVHGALKTPVKTNEFFRAVEKRSAFARRQAIRQGISPEDANAYLQRPEVQAGILAKSYEDAQRAILMQDNAIVKFYRMGLNFAESKGALGKTVSKAGQFVLPIVKVPTNFVFEASSYAAGGPKALATLLWHGVSELPPEQADYVMRNLKKQTMGTALMSVGFFLPEMFGGYYQRGDEKDKEKSEPGGMRLAGHDVPRWLLHNPALEMAQIGATVRRVYEKEKQKESDSPVAEGIFQAVKGLVKEIPFFEEQGRLADAFNNWQGFRKFAGEAARSAIIPPDVQRAAKEGVPFTGGKFGDVDTKGEPVKRYPQGFMDEIKSGIPGLREEVSSSNLEPGYQRGVKPSEPVKSELERLNIPAPDADKKLSIGGKEFDLTPEQQKKYREDVKAAAYPILEKLFANPAYQTLPDDAKKRRVESAIGSARLPVEAELKTELLPHNRRLEAEAGRAARRAGKSEDVSRELKVQEVRERRRARRYGVQ